MKYKKIMSFFAMAAAFSILIRTLQVVFTIDDKGFVINEYKKIAYIITLLQVAAIGVAAFFGYLAHRCPPKPPKVGVLLGTVSAFLGVWIIVDIFLFAPSVAIAMWQSSLIKLFGLLSGIILIIYSLTNILPVKLPPIVFAVPVLFWVMRLIWTFTTVNTLALTSGHVLLLLTYCSVLVYYLEFAKLMNGIDKEYIFKKILSSGIASVALCFTFSVPYLIDMLMGGNAASVEGYSPVFLLFANGCFTAIFLFCYFNNKNLRRRSRRHRTRMLDIDADVDRFYTGD